MVIERAEVEGILAIADPAARNRAITRAYVGLTEAFAATVDPVDLPWTAFGAWTSAQVGTAIRGELTARSPELRAARRVLRDYDERTATVATALAAGNAAVFAHLAPAFVAFLAAARTGDPRRVAVAVDGLDGRPWGEGLVHPPLTLRDAFVAYARLLDGEGDATARARLVLRANLVLAVVEQSRVQRDVEVAFTALAPQSRLGRLLTPDRLVRRLVDRVVTEFVLEVRLGDHVVRPGRGLPPGPAPDGLVDLGADPRLAPFAALLVEDRRLQAAHWSDLGDRLRFIAGLMRRLQRDGSLRRAPVEGER